MMLNYPVMWLVGILMMLFWLAIIAAVIFLFIKVVGGGNRTTHHNAPRIDKALETLNERYSKGEIDDEEYIRRKKNLLS